MFDEYGFDLVSLIEESFGIGIAKQWRTAQQLAESNDGLHGERDVAISSFVDAVGRTEVGVGVVDRAALREFAAVVQICGEHFELQIKRGLEQAYFYAAACAGDVPATRFASELPPVKVVTVAMFTNGGENRRFVIGF